MHLLINFTFPSLGDLDHMVWFGIIGTAGLVLGIGATQVVHRHFNVDDSRGVVRTLFVTNALYIASVVIVALTGNFALVVAVFLSGGVVRRASGPVLDTWTNQHLRSSVRATVFSMPSQSVALGQVAFGSAMGAVATATTIRAALTGVAALLLPVQGIYLCVMGQRDG